MIMNDPERHGWLENGDTNHYKPQSSYQSPKSVDSRDGAPPWNEIPYEGDSVTDLW